MALFSGHISPLFSGALSRSPVNEVNEVTRTSHIIGVETGLNRTYQQLLFSRRDSIIIRPADHLWKPRVPFPLSYSLATFLLDFAQRWITLHVPPTAQCSERAYGSASRVRARAFDFVTGH